MRAQTRRDHQGGFTLIEVVIAMTIGSILIGAIATALMTGIGSATFSLERIEASARQQLASSWFLTDVASAQTARLGGDITAVCDGDYDEADVLVQLERARAEGSRRADWWLDPVDGDVARLMRTSCDVAGDGTSSDQAQQVVWRVVVDGTRDPEPDCGDERCRLRFHEASDSSYVGEQLRELTANRRVVP